VTGSRLRVGLDLDGSLESLDNSLTDLADELESTGGCDLVRFRTLSARRSADERRLVLRALWAPLWRRSRGRPIDEMLPALDVVHVAGLATPPTRRVPLVISVDDLRPLREEARSHQRVNQLRRAVDHGAILVASTQAASGEVQRVLGLERSEIVVVPPAVGLVAPTVDGHDLVVNLAGLSEPFLSLAPDLTRFAASQGARVVVLCSNSASQRIRSAGVDVTLMDRRQGRAALARAHVVLNMSDGARFPSLAIAAMGAGVPTLARATPINRELLAGAAALIESDTDILATLGEIWSNDARRAVMVAAGHARSFDFSPPVAATAYAALYRDVVRGWRG
jgi:hypothetical protein